MKNKKYSLTADRLTNPVSKDWLSFKTTAELPPSRGMFGQDRAMRAVDLGLRVNTRGFNIFVAGEPGSGKTSTLERILKERARNEDVPQDLCYVYNFDEPDRPRPLMLPAGKGSELARDMERVVSELERMIPRVLSESSFGHIRTSIMADTHKAAEELVRRAANAAKRLDLSIEEDDDTLRVMALKDGVPLDKEGFEKLDRASRGRIEANILAFQEHLDVFSYGKRQLEQKHRKRMKDAEIRTITPIVREILGEVMSRYRDLGESVSNYLEDVQNSILENHQDFISSDGGDEGEEGDDGPLQDPAGDSSPLDPHLIYQVNVVVDRKNQEGAPVVVETVPTSANLSGYFEYREAQGGLVTDHTMIRAGALHEANGGYLLLQANELLYQDGAWTCLKRALRHKAIRIEEGSGEGRPRIAGMMKPGTAELQVKVVLVGSHETYHIVKMEDEEFSRLFKIKADFQRSMSRNRTNVTKLARFLGKVCREEGYLPIHRTGMERLIEFASRQVEHQKRMTTRRADLLDLLAVANLIAQEDEAQAIGKKHVEAALREKLEREGAYAVVMDRAFHEGAIIIRTSGMSVGQINGIALYDVTGSSFGIPIRITARAYAGAGGVVNIDREVQLSGAVHDKGTLILEGYLGGRYAVRQRLELSASITLEQSYDEIDGDSASGAELYVLLSALSGCPINQGIAVTGSVNQLGEIQPIGGVNEKIEGIFRICKNRGLTGDQGVMIPKSNLKNLMLSSEVAQAVKDGRFTIYAVTTVDQGIEVLTGVPAGKRRKDGTWTPGSISERVATRLESLRVALKEEKS